MRDFTKSGKDKITIWDARSGSEIDLYYRNPTTEEEVHYRSKILKRKGKKLVVNQDIRLRLGLEIMTGFSDGAFGVDGQPISADPASPAYRPDWKKLISENAADLVMILALAVFEGSKARGTDQEEETGLLGDDEEEEDILPLPTS